MCNAPGTVLTRLGALALGAVVALGGCGSAPPRAEAADAAKATTGQEYVIGPGDALNIFVWRNPELSSNIPVRPDGKISTPLVEDMVAAGKTPTQLARDLETALAKYVRSPQVNVIVTGFVGAASEQIKVVGQAANPRTIAFRAGMTVLDVMIAVGGLTEFAAGNRAKILRRTPEGTKEIRVRLDDLLNDGDIRQNVEMTPGDVVIIPESRF
jgi:polysaccharide export outer membrane protein